MNYHIVPIIQRVKKEKGSATADIFWSSLVVTEAASMLTGKNYGKKGDSNWQQVALCEGWAYYREWGMAKKYLSYNSLGTNKANGQPFYFSNFRFPINFGEMFDKLQAIGCSDENMQKALCVYTIEEYRDKLIQYYPALSIAITNIVN